MQDFGQWLPQSQSTADLYFSSMMSIQLDNSIEIQSRNSAVALLEKESAHPFGVRSAPGPIEVTRSAAGTIDVTRNDAGAIEDVQNGAGPTEVIDLNNTPPPKPKRKKHRPKVLRPPKAPKSATPKPSKAKEEKPSGKRKYVRKNTPAGQPPPEQTGDSHCRSKLKPAKRCLNLDGDVPQESRHPGSQAQLISAAPKDYQPSGSSTSQSNVQTQLPCHVGFTTGSMYSSTNQMAGAQLLPADNTETAIYSSANEMANAQFLPALDMPKGVLLDLNSSTDQIQHEYANFVDMPAQFFQSGIRETLHKDPLLEPRAELPNKNLPDLNSSASLLQGMPSNFTEYLLASPQASVRETHMDKQMLNCHRIPENPITTAHFSEGVAVTEDLNSSASLLQGMPSNFTEYLLASPHASLRETHMDKQMLNCHRIPENPITTAQFSEGVAVTENFNPNPCSREAWATDQMSHGYRSTQNPMSRPKHIEGHSMIENLSEFTTIDDYLKFMTSSYMQTGGALGLHGSHGSSHMHALDTRGEHNASSGAHISLGVNFDQQRNGWASKGVCHAATSRGSYFPETYKRMRTDNHSNCLNGGVDNISTPSMYLSNNRNTNVVSAINSNVFTLADAQRLIAREKSRASRGMISFGASGNNMVRRQEMIQQHHEPAMHGTACRDSIEASDSHFRLITENYTQLPSNPNTLQSQNHIPSIESCQLHFLEGNTVKGSDLPAELHKPSTSPQNDTRYSFCIGPSDELGRSISGKKIRSTVIPTTQSKGIDTLKVFSFQLESSGEVDRPLTNPINPSPGTDVVRNENRQLEVCGETTAAKSSEKRKVGRPRKEIKPGEMPKPRGRPRKEKVIGPEFKSKGSHTDQLQNEDICSVSGPHVADASGFKELNTERSGESFPGVIAPLVDPLDLIIQRIKVLDINKFDDTRAPELHGALVPYKGEFGALVPYEGKVKRKRDRAKVNLDPVTALMWKLLMEPDMVDGSEEMDQDKEKWLDEERKIFRGRIDSFIARMHLVQGDRRFSPWKGSVVDSVVGVFLTQNVSDHLSSSAFMALAAKFPAKPEASRIPSSRMFHTMPEENGDCSGLFGNSVKLQGSILIEEASNTSGSLVTTEEKEGSNSVGLFGNSPGDGVDCAGAYHNSYGTLPVRLHESKTLALGTESAVEAEDVALEDVVSSQNSAVSSQSSPDYLLHMTDHMFPSTLVSFTAEDFAGRNMPNGTSNSTTYTELLRMQELKSKPNENNGSSQYDRVPVPCTNMGSMPSEVDNLSSKRQPLHSSLSYHQNDQAHLPDITYATALESSVYSGLSRTDDSNVTPAETRFDCPSYSPGIDSGKTKMADSLTALSYDTDGSLCQHKTLFPSATTRGADFISPIMDTYFHLSSSETVPFAKEQSFEKNLSRNDVVAAFVKQHVTPNLQEECAIKANQIGGENHQSGCSQQYGNVGLPRNKDGSHYSSNLYQSEKANSELLQGVASDLIEKPKDTKKAFPEVPTDRSKTKNARVGARKKKTYDWDILRQEVLVNRGHEERPPNAKDTLDWETIRQIDVKEVSDTIRERGMNNMLAERIKAFLNRLVTDHGAIDLEWLRYADPDKAKEYLLSIRGLGLKSVECVRLLTLHHMAFPVDTNVGRICVRLGWVPLQPLPESLQLHLLELYPMLENIQKYLWPRLCKLDQRTLYELHYQMITFGKVFCTKSKPNCNACPMRAECKHFASAFASARLALPGPEERSLVPSGNPIAAESCHQPCTSYRPVNQLDWNAHVHVHVLDNRQPIIEEPASPEPETAEIKESAIEDSFFDDPEEIPTIKLNFEEFAQNLKNYMQVNNIEIEDADMSSALVAITPEAASIPTPRLKNISRLRTEHQVYELPDSHPLLEGYDQREPDDPCPYLLSIWTPGETAQSTDAPKTSCNSHESGKLCDSSACFSCNSIREAQAQKVRGTILVPCRTAMRGSFPLNGTYFQVNEVFADHDSSRNPVDVPRRWIWDLPKRTVYFGTSVPSIFKGLTTEDIQHCFWRGFVCVRGFDRISRAPRPLYARLHFPASKITRNKKAAATDDE